MLPWKPILQYYHNNNNNNNTTLALKELPIHFSKLTVS